MTASDHIAHKLDAILEPLHVRVRFGELAIRELTDYPKDIQNHMVWESHYTANLSVLLKSNQCPFHLESSIVHVKLTNSFTWRSLQSTQGKGMRCIGMRPKEYCGFVVRFRREMQE